MLSMKSRDPGALEKAAGVLLGNGVAIIPTDTVYGLAAHPARPAAVARLQTVKAREKAKPVAMLMASPGLLPLFCPNPPPLALALAQRFWPGPLTLVLETPGGTEGFRVPDHAFCRALLARCGNVLRVTSANLAGQTPATSAVAAFNALGLAADLLVDDGPSPGGLASTVLRITPDNTPTLLREGAIPHAECLT